MRQTTAALRRELAAAEQAYECLATAHEKEVAFLDKLDRAITERRDDMHKLIDSTFGSISSEIAVIRDMKAGVIAELRGQNMILANPHQPAMPAVSGPDEAEDMEGGR